MTTSTQSAADRLRANAELAKELADQVDRSDHHELMVFGTVDFATETIRRQAKQINTLVEALEWYADDEHWESNNGWNDYYADVMEDMGNKARTALNAALALEGDDDN